MAGPSQELDRHVRARALRPDREGLRPGRRRPVVRAGPALAPRAGRRNAGHAERARARRRDGHRGGCDCAGAAVRLPRDRARPVARDARDRSATRGACRARRPHRARRGPRAELPFDDGSFDGVTATYVLRYVEDVPAAVRELARVARPGSPVGYLDFGVPPLPPARAAWERTRARAFRSPDARWVTAGWRSGASSTARSAVRWHYPPPRLAAVFDGRRSR